MASSTRLLAVVTGASSGIGLELATRCAEEGFDLLTAADEAIDEASRTLREAGGGDGDSREPRGPGNDENQMKTRKAGSR